MLKSVTPATGEAEAEWCKFKVNLGNLVRACLKMTHTQRLGM